MTTTPTIGLIVPPAHGQVPDDGPQLYGDRVRFIARGLGLGEVSIRGYEGVIDTVVDHARELARQGAQAVSLMGTSLSFYRGAAFNRELVRAMAEATGLPCTTMSNAVVRALRALGVHEVAVATAYIDEVNEQLVRYLRDEGLEPTAVQGLDIRGVDAMHQVPASRLIDLCRSVFERRSDSDGILISCGGLLTLEVIEPVERELGVPAASSSLAGFWDVMRTAGLDPRSAQGGRLFTLDAKAPA